MRDDRAWHCICRFGGMTRALAIAVVGLLLTGCAGSSKKSTCSECCKPKLTTTRTVHFDSQEASAEPVLAAATLAFEPLIEPAEHGLDLARDSRAPRAFLGYDEGVTEYFYVRTDDTQRDFRGGSFWGSGDRYERQSISVKSGVRYR